MTMRIGLLGKAAACAYALLPSSKNKLNPTAPALNKQKAKIFRVARAISNDIGVPVEDLVEPMICNQ